MVDKNFTNVLNKHNRFLRNAAETGALDDANSLMSRSCDINQSDFKGVTTLMVEAKAGNKEIVKYLCEKGANVNKLTNNGETALYIACDNVNRDIVELLLDAGSDVNIQTNDLHPQTGRSPLLAALPSTYEINFNKRTKSEAIDIVKLLLSSGCDVDARDWKGNTALHLAATQNDLHTVCLLAENGANLHIRNNYALTPFEESIQPNIQHYSVAIILLLYGYDIEYVPSETSPLVQVIKGISHPQANYFNASRIPRKVLLDLMFNVVHMDANLEGKIKDLLNNCPNITSDELRHCQRFLATERPTSLQHLCRFVIRRAIGKRLIRGILQLPVAKSIKHFLALNVEIERRDPLKILELNTAVKEDDIEQVKLLVNKQIDVNFSFSEQTPLTEAAKIGNFQLCKFFLENGADVDLADNVGMTALHWAAANGHRSVAEELFKHGADANAMDIFCSENALIKAASNCHFTTMVLLLEQGCNACLSKKDGIFAIHLAAGSGNVMATEALLTHGISPETRDRNRNTPLHIAASRGILYKRENIEISLLSKSCDYHEVIKLLLRAGADMAALNKYNKTPFDIAVSHSCEDIAALFTGQ